MSFSFRDKPRLSDRLRGKSGDELINELKNQIDEERKMFFDSAPNWGSVHPSGPFTSRTGFPFDDDMIPRAGRQDIRSHLDDLAQRHPEFADQLRCPPWAGEMSGSPAHTGSWGRNRRGSNEGEGHSSSSSVGSNETGATSPKSEESRGRNPILQHGLRNTVDLGQKQGEVGRDDAGNRGQRSMSAPPDGRNQQSSEAPKQSQQPQQPQRFVSRVNITPGKPPVAPQKQQSPQQPASNVRHIPIFVEGRDEPILPKNVAEEPPVEKVFSQRIPPQPQQTFAKPQTFTSHHQFQPQNKFYNPPQQTRTEHGRPQQNISQPKPETIFTQQVPVQNAQHNATTQQPKEIPKPAQQQHKPQPNDPMNRVQAVQKDVENLQRMVENFSGTSRKDKQYIYLDEMLTRNLLKLDDIDTEGKENVRQARKDVIRSIQRCISILESKVPTAEEQNVAAISEETEEAQSAESNGKTERGEESKSERMEVEAEESTQPEKMDTEGSGPQPVAVQGAEEKTDFVEQQSNENAEKMDAEPLVKSSEDEQQLQIEDTSATKVSEVDKEDKKASSGQQLTTEIVVDTEAPGTSKVPGEHLTQGNVEKGESTEMEVEPVQAVAPEQTEIVVEALTDENKLLKSDTGPQNIAKGANVPGHEQELSDATAVVQGGTGEIVISEAKELGAAETEDKTAMQIEPLPSSSDIKDPPKTEESSTVTVEPEKQIICDQDTKQEADLKKKKTGKKSKSPAKKPIKQPSKTKPDGVASAEETQS